MGQFDGECPGLLSDTASIIVRHLREGLKIAGLGGLHFHSCCMDGEAYRRVKRAHEHPCAQRVLGSVSVRFQVVLIHVAYVHWQCGLISQKIDAPKTRPTCLLSAPDERKSACVVHGDGNLVERYRAVLKRQNFWRSDLRWMLQMDRGLLLKLF